MRRFLLFLLILTLPLPWGMDGMAVASDTLHEEADSLVSDGETLFEESKQAMREGDLVRALQLAMDAEALFEEAKDAEKIVKSYILRAEIQLQMRERDIAIEILEAALERFPETSRLPQIHHLLGNIHVDMNPMRSVEEYNAALASIDRLPEDERGVIKTRTHHNLALTYNNIGQQELAYRNYLDTINLAEASQDSVVLTVVYNNLGMSYGQDEDYERSQYYLERSLQMAEQRNSHIDMYRAHINLGNVFNNTERYEEALQSFNSALEALGHFEPDRESANLTHNIGRTLAMMKRYREAEVHLFKVFEIGREQNSPLAMFLSSLVLGRMYTEEGKPVDARVHLGTAEEFAQLLPNAYYKLDVKKSLHELYASEGRFEEAYNQLMRYSVLADSLNEATHSEELANAENYLELRRQNDINRLLMEKQTEQEFRINNQRMLIIVGLLIILMTILLLYQMRRASRDKEQMLTLLEKQKGELEEVNRSKDKLFAIVSHDLRGTLGSMQSILSLIKDNILTVEEFQELIPLMEASVQENLNVMEDLLAWAQGQISEVKLYLEEIELTGFLEEVIHSQKFIADKKNIQIELEPAGPYTVLADCNALKLVLRNLISNAIKFSYENDPVTISLSQQDDQVRVEVRDKGIGIPEEMQGNIFDNKNWTRRGTRNEKGTGFGLSLSKEFIERMNGRIFFTSKEGKGSSFFMEMPLKEGSAKTISEMKSDQA